MLPKILLGEFHDKPYIYIVSKCLSGCCLLVMKKESSNLIVKNLGRPINQAIKISTTQYWANQYYGPPAMQWGHSILPVAFLPKMHTLNLIVRKHQTMPEWGIQCIIQTCQSLLFENVKVEKGKKNVWETVPDETWWLNAMCDPGIDPGLKKKELWRSLWRQWRNLNMECELDDRFELIVNFLCLLLALFLCRRMSLFLEEEKTCNI